MSIVYNDSYPNFLSVFFPTTVFHTFQWGLAEGEDTPDSAYLDLAEPYVDETGKVSIRWKFPDQPTPSPALLDKIQADRAVEVGTGDGADSGFGGPGMVSGADTAAGGDGTNGEFNCCPLVNGGGEALDSNGQVITDESGNPVVLQTDDQGKPILDSDGNASNTSGETIDTSTLSNTNGDASTGAEGEDGGLDTGDALSENDPNVSDGLNPDGSTDRVVELAVPYPPEEPAPMDTEVTEDEPEIPMAPGIDIPMAQAPEQDVPLDTEFTEDEPLVDPVFPGIDVEGTGASQTDAPVAAPTLPNQLPTWDDNSTWEWPNPPENIGIEETEAGQTPAPVPAPKTPAPVPVPVPATPATDNPCPCRATDRARAATNGP